MKPILLFSLLLFSTITFSQKQERIASLTALERKQIDRVEKEETNTVTYLPSVFAEDQLIFESLPKLEELTILKVYYVYTQYKLSRSFNQLALDKRRFSLLNKHYPFLLDDPFIEWEILEQTGCSTFEEGDEYFHGFIFVHRPIYSEESRMDEINSIINYFENPTDHFIDDKVDPIQEQVEKNRTSNEQTEESKEEQKENTRAEYSLGNFELYEYFKTHLKNSQEVVLKRDDIWVDTKFKVDENGKISDIKFLEEYADYIKDEVSHTLNTMPDWDPAVKDGKKVSSEVNLQIRVSYSGSVKGMYKRDHIKPIFEAKVVELIEEPEESINIGIQPHKEIIDIKTTTIYRGLELIDRSKKIALVMDVTGSMNSHIAGMKKWIIMNHHNLPFTSYTFFNDGNNKSTKKKKVGATGGIYSTTSSAEIKQLIKSTMLKGNGGERPENDVEAILYAIENDPSCDEILLIGDNYSEVRDLELLDKVSRIVHVLPCAAPKLVRPDYLNIARITGGHLILNGKIIELDQVASGASFFIGETEYKFDGRKFKLKR
jgi:hypothetical protein